MRMSITAKSSVLSAIQTVTTGESLVTEFNRNVDIINLLTANQSTGIIGTPGKVIFTVTGVDTELTSNFNVGLGNGTEATLGLEDWSVYFSNTKNIVTVNSLPAPIALSTPAGYIYLDSTGAAIIVSEPYSAYQADKARLLKFEQNSAGIYSIVIMPEMSGTPKYLRSISLNEPLLKVTDFALEPTLLKLKRTSTKCLTEGAGCYSAFDANILIFTDENEVRFVDENSNVEYDSIDTGIASALYKTKQLSLAYDGKLVVQDGTTEYTSLEEAIIELPYESFPLVNGDVVGEYAAVARIAFLEGTADLADVDEAYILDLTKSTELIRTPVWYTK
jgi:hypothetical protein